MRKSHRGIRGFRGQTVLGVVVAQVGHANPIAGVLQHHLVRLPVLLLQEGFFVDGQTRRLLIHWLLTHIFDWVFADANLRRGKRVPAVRNSVQVLLQQLSGGLPALRVRVRSFGAVVWE